MLELIEKSISAIRNLLLNNEKIRKLLYNDSNAALTLEAPLEEEVHDLVVTAPVYNLLDNNAYSKNSLININITRISYDEDVSALIRINIFTNVEKWNLIDNKIRPIQIANEIIKTLNNKKLNASNPIYFNSMDQIVYNKNIVGYDLFFSMIDGNGELDKY